MSVDIIEITSMESVIENVAAAPPSIVEFLESPVAVIEVVTVGPQGATGQTGEQGEQGEVGPSPQYEQTFATATDVWIIPHTLGGHPEVTTVDLNGVEIIGDVDYTTPDTVTVWFGMPVAGTARLKA